MTAFAGITGQSRDCPADAIVNAMLAAQARYATLPAVACALDHATFGRALYPMLAEDAQDTGPQVSRDGNILCVADARLDNRAALAAALDLPLMVLSSMCDAALVLAAWQTWGTDAFDRLRGDFAVAIYDREQRRLVLARDFLGQRPLFYLCTANIFAFASMPSGLLALPWLKAGADKAALADYLTMRRGQTGHSFFADIATVPPGHWLAVDAHGIEQHRYWTPPAVGSATGDKGTRTATARALFDTAVAGCLRDATTVGSHLSGGIDSGAVTLAAARQLGDGQQVIGFTAIPPPQLSIDDPRGRFINEAPLAALSASRETTIVHRCVAAELADLSNRWDQAAALFQCPLPNPCNYRWAAAIFDQAQLDGVTTLLTGQMGNLSISYQLPHAGFGGKPAAGSLIDALRFVARSLRTAVRSVMAVERKQGFLTAGASADFAAPEPLPQPQNSRDARIAALDRLDFGLFNKGVLAGWGIDVRDPTADRDLIDYCLSLPDEDFVEAGQDRALARRAFADLLPADVLIERRRGLQSADWRLAMLTDLPALLAEIEQARADPLAMSLIDLDALSSALQAMGTYIAPGQPDEPLLRQAGLRAIAALHFIRTTFAD